MSRNERKARALQRVDRMADDAFDTSAVRDDAPSSRGSAAPAYHAVPAASARAAQFIMSRDDGWLRAIPARDGKSLYLKWKFDRGPWERHYIMAVVQADQFFWGLELLEAKLEEVDNKLRKPSPDTLYGADHPGSSGDA